MLPTPARCRAKAKEKAELAEPDPRLPQKPHVGCSGMASLADKMEEVDNIIRNAEGNARKADDTNFASPKAASVGGLFWQWRRGCAN